MVDFNTFEYALVDSLESQEMNIYIRPNRKPDQAAPSRVWKSIGFIYTTPTVSS